MNFCRNLNPPSVMLFKLKPFWFNIYAFNCICAKNLTLIWKDGDALQLTCKHLVASENGSTKSPIIITLVCRCVKNYNYN